MSDARRWATFGLMAAAGRAHDELHRDPVACADARTSACDWRATLAIAAGADPDDLDPARGTRRP